MTKTRTVLPTSFLSGDLGRILIFESCFWFLDYGQLCGVCSNILMRSRETAILPCFLVLGYWAVELGAHRSFPQPCVFYHAMLPFWFYPLLFVYSKAKRSTPQGPVADRGIVWLTLCLLPPRSSVD